MRKRQHDLFAFQAELFLDLIECGVTHYLGNALKIAGDQNDLATVRIFQGESFHPEIMQFSIRGSF